MRPVIGSGFGLEGARSRLVQQRERAVDSAGARFRKCGQRALNPCVQANSARCARGRAVAKPYFRVCGDSMSTLERIATVPELAGFPLACTRRCSRSPSTRAGRSGPSRSKPTARSCSAPSTSFAARSAVSAAATPRARARTREGDRRGDAARHPPLRAQPARRRRRRPSCASSTREQLVDEAFRLFARPPSPPVQIDVEAFKAMFGATEGAIELDEPDDPLGEEWGADPRAVHTLRRRRPRRRRDAPAHARGVHVEGQGGRSARGGVPGDGRHREDGASRRSSPSAPRRRGADALLRCALPGSRRPAQATDLPDSRVDTIVDELDREYQEALERDRPVDPASCAPIGPSLAGVHALVDDEQAIAIALREPYDAARRDALMTKIDFGAGARGELRARICAHAWAAGASCMCSPSPPIGAHARGRTARPERDRDRARGRAGCADDDDRRSRRTSASAASAEGSAPTTSSPTSPTCSSTGWS